MGAGLLFGDVRGSRRHPSGSKLRPGRGRAATRRKAQSGRGLFDVSLLSGPDSRPRSNSERGTDRSRVAWLLVIVTAACFLAGLYAAFSHRGLFADGSYYLIKVVQQQ